MFEQDYLVRMILDFIEAINRSIDRATCKRDPLGAASALDHAVGNATDFDETTLLSLAPESVAQILQVSGIDPHLVGYVVQSLLLAGRYYGEAHEASVENLRVAQAHAIAQAFNYPLTEEDGDPEVLQKRFADNGS